jgi:hypothetical protein
MSDTTTEPSFVLKASDPAAPFALLAYASAARNNGMPDAYCSEIRTLADDMYDWQEAHGVTTTRPSSIPQPWHPSGDGGDGDLWWREPELPLS